MFWLFLFTSLGCAFSLSDQFFFSFRPSLCSIRAACCCSSYTLFFIRGFHAHTLFLYTYTYCCLHLLYSHTCVWLWLCDSLARSNTYNAIRLNFYSSMMAVVIQLLLLLLIVRCYSLPSPYMHQVRVFAQNSPIISRRVEVDASTFLAMRCKRRRRQIDDVCSEIFLDSPHHIHTIKGLTTLCVLS